MREEKKDGNQKTETSTHNEVPGTIGSLLGTLENTVVQLYHQWPQAADLRNEEGKLEIRMVLRFKVQLMVKENISRLFTTEIYTECVKTRSYVYEP